MKQPVDIVVMARRIEAAVRPYPKAAMVELAEKGFTSSFEQLVACTVSIRTYDEVSLIAAKLVRQGARQPRWRHSTQPRSIHSSTARLFTTARRSKFATSRSRWWAHMVASSAATEI
jgi:hypothetical protein